MLIQTIALITICSIGLGANSCALLVLLKSSIIKSTTGIYLSFLAVFDNLVLVTQLVYSFSHVVHLSNFACKLFWMLRIPVVTISNHIVVTMTIEKCYVLVNPYKTKPTRKQALIVATASVTIITLVSAIQAGITHGLVSAPVDRDFINSSVNVTVDNNFPMIGNEKTVCGVLPQYEEFSQKVLSVVSMVFIRTLAPVIVIICNLIIIKSLRKHANQVAPLNATSTINNDKRITKLLIIISLCFAVLTLPSSIYILLAPYFYDDLSNAVATESPAFQVVLDCLLINHSVNYFLYIMAGKTFRKEALAAFKSLFTICTGNNQN